MTAARTTMVAAAVAAACGPSVRTSAPATGTAAPGAEVSIAIYPSTAIVREQRRVTLAAGRGELRFDDMPSGLDVGSVRFVSLSDPEGTRAVAQRVHTEPRRERELPAWVELTGDDARPLRLRPRPDVERHAAIAEGVTWTVESERGGEQQVAVSYQTGGLTWRADYAIVLADDGGDTADVNAWITVDNRSGRSYEAAEVALVVREKDKPVPPPPPGAPSPSNLYDGRGYNASYPAQQQYAPPSPPAPRYRAYRFRRPVTLRDRAQRQLEWFDRPLRGVACNKVVLYDPIGAELDQDDAQPVKAPGYGLAAADDGPVSVAIELPDVGRELPPGRVRVFERSASGALSLLGDATLERVEAGDPLRVKLGAVPGLTGTRKQTDFRADDRTHRVVEEFEIELANSGERPREVIVREHLYRGARFEIPFANAPHRPDGDRAVRFEVTVPAGGEQTIRYRVVYSWPEEAGESAEPRQP